MPTSPHAHDLQEEGLALDELDDHVVETDAQGEGTSVSV